jgi:signal transduction histidine kinase
MGQIEVANAPFDVETQVETTLRAGGSFTTDVNVTSGPGRIRAVGDPARVRQIVRNLLTNAERYGGSVVTIDITKVDDRVVVAVADDGPGLPRQEWDKIFEPYHRGHHTPGRPGSVGIGLAISRQLAELMGGTLTYTYEQGRSVFVLSLRAEKGRD